MRFDHVILAIRLDDKISDASLYSTIKDDKLGRLLLFDPTNPYVPLGYLPSYLQATYALLVTPEGGTLVETPLLPPSTNRLLRTAKLDLSPQGNFRAGSTGIAMGRACRSGTRAVSRNASGKRAKVLEDFVGNFFNSFTLTSASMGNLEKYDDDLVLTYKFVVQGYAKTAGRSADRPAARARQQGLVCLQARSNGKPRKYPIEFSEATRQDDMFDITLPARLRRRRAAAAGPGAMRLRNLQKSNSSHRRHAALQAHVRSQRRPRSHREAGRRPGFFRQVAADERSSAVLKRAGN